MPEVVQKIKKDRAQGILIMPDWPDRNFPQMVAPVVVQKCLFPTGSRMFKTLTGYAGPIQWPVWALVVNGNQNSPEPLILEEGVEYE